MPVEVMRDSLPNPDGDWGSAPCRIFTGIYIKEGVDAVIDAEEVVYFEDKYGWGALTDIEEPDPDCY